MGSSNNGFDENRERYQDHPFVKGRGTDQAHPGSSGDFLDGLEDVEERHRFEHSWENDPRERGGKRGVPTKLRHSEPKVFAPDAKKIKLIEAYWASLTNPERRALCTIPVSDTYDGFRREEYKVRVRVRLLGLAES